MVLVELLHSVMEVVCSLLDWVSTPPSLHCYRTDLVLEWLSWRVLDAPVCRLEGFIEGTLHR